MARLASGRRPTTIGGIAGSVSTKAPKATSRNLSGLRTTTCLVSAMATAIATTRQTQQTILLYQKTVRGRMATRVGCPASQSIELIYVSGGWKTLVNRNRCQKRGETAYSAFNPSRHV